MNKFLNPKTLITAHSGCDGTPDNSVRFIESALTNGTDAFEVDVNIGPRDGILYLRHDPDPAGTYAGCPTLSQAFRLMASNENVKINCDLKSHGLERAVMEAAGREGVSDRLVFSGSVGLDFLEDNPSVHRTVDVFLNIEEIFGTPMDRLRDRLRAAPQDLPAIARQAANACLKLGVTVINVPYKICDETFIEIMDESGIGISAWTVNESDDIERLLEYGVANITTRRAALAVSVRKAFIERKILEQGGAKGA